MRDRVVNLKIIEVKEVCGVNVSNISWKNTLIYYIGCR